MLTDIPKYISKTKPAVTPEHLQAVIDNINCGVTAIVLNGGGLEFVFATDKYYDLLGYTREQYADELKDVFGAIHRDDLGWVSSRVEELYHAGKAATIEFRAIRRDGAEIWLRDVISITRFADIDMPVQLSVFTDITAERQAREKLRVSEDHLRIAVTQGGRWLARYDVKTGTYYDDNEILFAEGLGREIPNMPQAFVEAGVIAPESVAEYLDFYDKIKNGEQHCSTNVFIRMPDGEYRWLHYNANVIFDSSGAPSQAVIVFYDITEQLNKESVYNKWQQSLREKDPGSYTLFRYNLSKDTPFDSVEGTLLQVKLIKGPSAFRSQTLEYAAQNVYPEDYAEYMAFLDADALLAHYYRGRRTHTLEYREMLPEGGVRWLRITVELVEYPSSTDVEAFLMYEDIDESKRTELLVKELAETDPLTGVLNRTTFTAKFNQIISESGANARHALLILDLDGFKQLNDCFGHGAGDQAIIDTANSLRSILRRSDLLCRLGGDEFMLCFRDVPEEDGVVRQKATQICSMLRRSYSIDVQISASVGVSLYPEDGTDFDTLYRNADAALYHVKESGRDNFIFYDSEMDGRDYEPHRQEKHATYADRARSTAKRRMLIVDDSELDLRILSSLFNQEFTIMKAKDGGKALALLRHYGTAVSLVLLDLYMPGMDGFTVLEKMRNSAEMQSIPVIVVSASEDRDISLRAIRGGAADFVTKPIDHDLIRLRVPSAISRAENERLRAQNSLLTMQNDEISKYRLVLENIGTAVVEYDWMNGTFLYDQSLSSYIAGNFNKRRLWYILLSDRVAAAGDVQNMQSLVHSIANDKRRASGSIVVPLKTPSGEVRRFRMDVYKMTNESSATTKIILTFNPVHDEG